MGDPGLDDSLHKPGEADVVDEADVLHDILAAGVENPVLPVLVRFATVTEIDEDVFDRRLGHRCDSQVLFLPIGHPLARCFLLEQLGDRPVHLLVVA